MKEEKRIHPKIKSKLHPRSQHRERYDFDKLTLAFPPLKEFVRPNKYDDISVDFSDPLAVTTLNQALLKYHYGIEHWDVPEGYLCPPIPGRADYIHHIADLLKDIGAKGHINCLDVGVGTNCIYPIIGVKEYGWSFVGSDIDEYAVKVAKTMVKVNPGLSKKVEIRHQVNTNNFFSGIVREGELFDITISNPPFHSSWEEAQASSLRKQSNLQKKRVTESKLNFGGKNTELWCPGGEKKFIHDMIKQSAKFAKNIGWFTTLVSKKENLASIYKMLDNVHVTDSRTINMGQGNKQSRIVAWTFLKGDTEKRD
jgi:23S rRNA (adenine1618-N6)-methyltransferase